MKGSDPREYLVFYRQETGDEINYAWYSTRDLALAAVSRLENRPEEILSIKLLKVIGRTTSTFKLDEVA